MDLLPAVALVLFVAALVVGVGNVIVGAAWTAWEKLRDLWA